jgi:hypothetical protein
MPRFHDRRSWEAVWREMVLHHQKAQLLKAAVTYSVTVCRGSPLKICPRWGTSAVV